MSTMELMCPPWSSCVHHGAHVSTMELMCPPWSSCVHHGAHVSTMELMCPPWSSCAHHGAHVSTMELMCPPRSSCDHHGALYTVPSMLSETAFLPLKNNYGHTLITQGHADREGIGLTWYSHVALLGLNQHLAFGLYL